MLMELDQIAYAQPRKGNEAGAVNLVIRSGTRVLHERCGGFAVQAYLPQLLQRFFIGGEARDYCVGGERVCVQGRHYGGGLRRSRLEN